MVVRGSCRNDEDFVVFVCDDWRTIEKTLHVNQATGFVDSIHQTAERSLGYGTLKGRVKW